MTDAEVWAAMDDAGYEMFHPHRTETAWRTKTTGEQVGGSYLHMAGVLAEARRILTAAPPG